MGKAAWKARLGAIRKKKGKRQNCLPPESEKVKFKETWNLERKTTEPCRVFSFQSCSDTDVLCILAMYVLKESRKRKGSANTLYLKILFSKESYEQNWLFSLTRVCLSCLHTYKKSIIMHARHTIANSNHFGKWGQIKAKWVLVE